MNRREFLKALGLGMMTVAFPRLPVFAGKDGRPNIVWIMADDHAYHAIGAYGGRLAREHITPHIDRIAEEGMIFDRAYVANSLCSPSRATLLTGKHSHMNGKLDNYDAFDNNQQQFQKILQQSGYQTAIVGKFHLPCIPRGFDYWQVDPGQGVYMHPYYLTKQGMQHYFGYATTIIGDLALNWLKKGRDPSKPFMLMIHHKAPHRPWIPTESLVKDYYTRDFPEPPNLFDDYSGRGTAAHRQQMEIKRDLKWFKDLKMYRPDRRALLEIFQPRGAELVRFKYEAFLQDYLACVFGVDQQVGRILDYLEAAGLDQNTVVMYSSDQGLFLGEHGWFDKRFMYTESFRTPLIVRWPGVIAPGARNDDLVQNIDFAETFLDIAGAPIPPDMQGRSLVPLLKGQTPKDWRTSLYYHYYEYPGDHSVRRHEGVAGKRYKLIRFYGQDVPNGEEWEFYDLKTDPHEMQSLYDDPVQAGQVAAMKKELQRLRKYYKVPPGWQ